MEGRSLGADGWNGLNYETNDVDDNQSCEKTIEQDIRSLTTTATEKSVERAVSFWRASNSWSSWWEGRGSGAGAGGGS